MQKRQGYYPSTSYCGQGETCQEACGAQYEQCPSESGIYCFDPTVGDHCCRDGTGNSCNQGYYCTTDGADNTYCCPDGMDTVNCAASYSLTVSLIRASETAASEGPSATAPSSVVEAATTSLIHITSISPTVTGTSRPGSNATYTTGAPAEFTGGANKAMGAGVAVFAGAIGLAGLL
ncbi:hypothetical protein BS50DRAFT_500200 [Corynespora cassiicola Philippines]|uniref:Uncharacterized protein n=1 Tax=Corynespora cassiicola Philippines TaxID=1448308 RepID=A0A2T2NF94_CORCC|nr:hypothetical protein BS50DRAFT_500200 [Corynespora cassiicola Philippines]